jgi:hypothetical protein
MSTTPPKIERNQLGAALRLLLLGGILFAIGLVIILLVDRQESSGGTGEGIGVAFMSLATVPTLAGLVLTGVALVSRRARKGKPFA